MAQGRLSSDSRERTKKKISRSEPFRIDYKIYIYGHNYKMEETEDKIQVSVNETN
jgi:hypothetical protein